ncbi:MAG: methionine--tRNA ligase [Candidatus Micrarchaeota archaeon]
METYYLTTAIPYVNAAPHIGHVLEFIQTDVIARYQKSRGKEVALVTGADENSLKNVRAAEKEGITAAQLCDKNSAIFKDMADKIGLSYTTFRRTSDKEKHWAGVQRVWELCHKNGDIYSRKYRGLYCVGCEAFYDEGELVNGICPEHRTQPETVEEENYFFKLSNYQDKLETLIETNELEIIPETRKNEVLSFIRGGLKDFSISRSVTRAKGWGVPVPNDPSQIQYVWFDALGTYITGIGYGTDEKTFNKFWPANTHVIGKGILRFHAVYWPAILLSAGLKLPKSVLVHGYITVNGQKMSKSLGNIIDPFYLIEKYGVDPLRYCLLSEVPTFEDGDFSEKVLIETNNNELLANVGNLVNRTLVFIKNNFDGKIPQYGPQNEQDIVFLQQQAKTVEEIGKDLEKVKIRDGLHKIMQFSKNANKFFQDNKPWVSIKTERTRAETAIGILTTQVKDLAILLEPYLPATSSEIFAQLNMEPKKWTDISKPLQSGHGANDNSFATVQNANHSGHEIGNPKTIFKKIEQKEIEALKAKFSGKYVVEPKFSDLDLEVGEIIISAEKHPNAEKLFVERIRLSDGERQIVSGLAGHYFPEELVGRKVVIVKNLAPAKLRGIESQGMLLAAEGREFVPPHDGKEASASLTIANRSSRHGKAAMEVGALEVIFCDKSLIGDKVTLKNEKNLPKEVLTISEVEKIKILVKDFAVVCNDKQLITSAEELRMKNTKTGVVG